MEVDASRTITSNRRVDVEFEDLSYKADEKDILKSISGKFLSGQLTAVLGPSGSGKTSLLNILSGYIHGGVDGKVRVNGRLRETETFRKLSCYIMQDELLRTFISVREYINVAAELKLGKTVTPSNRHAVVDEVITVMGLDKCSDTRVENLSGGQRKRLSIALEMVNNPPIVFLDEPTTGLDNVVATKFVRFLKVLASRGRNVVCTIHQPSDLMFQLFDQVYFLSEGWCVYSGDADGTVAFLDGVSLPCPSTYSPCDYIIELVYESEINTALLRNAISNGRENIGKMEDGTQNVVCTVDNFPTSFRQQFYVLSRLMFTQMKRNRNVAITQLVSQISVALCLGVLFRCVGNDGDRMIQNLFLLYSSVMYQLFFFMLPQILLLPNEVKLLQREYFNRWYGLKAYYAAMSFVMLPQVVICTINFSLIIYFLTDQPLEAYRFFGFLLITFLSSLTSQALGQIIGSIFNEKIGALAGSSFACILLLTGVYAMGYADTMNMAEEIFTSLSYARHSFVAYTTLMLKGREIFSCDKIFCPFSDPRIVLRIFGIADKTYQVEILYLIVFAFALKLCTYLFLRVRVSSKADLKLQKYLKYFERINL